MSDDVEVVHLARGAVEVRHVPTGTVARCGRHPVSTMNLDEAMRELLLDLATMPDQTGGILTNQSTTSTPTEVNV